MFQSKLFKTLFETKQTSKKTERRLCNWTSWSALLCCLEDLICIPFVKQCSANELVSHFCWCCCCGRRTWCPSPITFAIGRCVLVHSADVWKNASISQKKHCIQCAICIHCCHLVDQSRHVQIVLISQVSCKNVHHFLKRDSYCRRPTPWLPRIFYVHKAASDTCKSNIFWGISVQKINLFWLTHIYLIQYFFLPKQNILDQLHRFTVFTHSNLCTKGHTFFC